MKKNTYIQLSAIATVWLALGACTTDTDPFGQEVADNSTLTVSQSEVKLNDKGEGSVNVRAHSSMDWYVDNYYELSDNLSFNFNHTTGSGTLKIEANENTDTKDIDYIVTLKSNRFDRRARVKVVNPGAYVEMTPKSPTFSGNGGRISIQLKSNINWRLGNYSSWLTASSYRGTRGETTNLTLTASSNPSTQPRYTTIYFFNSNYDPILSAEVTQSGAAPTLSISPETLEFPYSSDYSYVYIDTNAPSWSLGTINYQNDASDNWVSTTKYSGYFRVSVSRNYSLYDRTATIAINADTQTKTLTIKQSAAPETLSLSPSSVQIFQAAGNYAGYTRTYQDIDVDTNVGTWTVSGNASWVTITKYSSFFRIAVNSYSGTTIREATITVRAGSKTQTLTVRQLGQVSNDFDRDGFGADKTLD